MLDELVRGVDRRQKLTGGNGRCFGIARVERQISFGHFGHIGGVLRFRHIQRSASHDRSAERVGQRWLQSLGKNAGVMQTPVIATDLGERLLCRKDGIDQHIDLRVEPITRRRLARMQFVPIGEAEESAWPLDARHSVLRCASISGQKLGRACRGRYERCDLLHFGRKWKRGWIFFSRLL
ncbi:MULTISPECIES: hypothetical protein [unclassified Bradyrhizobium]|uniref:hypothetical protein n=1 Tax=unclassified Bradyrhizobium TaxID=2631580 RepID=UPI003511423E